MATPEKAADETRPETTAPARPWKPVLFFFIVAFVTRIIAIGRADLWCDEILFADLGALPKTPWGIYIEHLRKFLAIGHLPLPAMAQNIWLRVAGLFAEDLYHSPGIQRIPAVLWGSGAVAVFYLLARRLLHARTATMAALMMCFFYFPIHFSREAYMYAPLLFWTVLSLYFCVRFMQAGRASWFVGLGTVIALAAAAHCHVSGAVLALAICAGCVVVVAINRFPSEGDPQELRRRYMGFAGLCLLALLSVVPFYLQYLTKSSPMGFKPQPPWWFMLTDMMGKIFLGTAPLAIVWPWVFLVVGCVSVWRSEDRRGMKRFVAGLTLASTLVLLIGSVKTLYVSRYFHIALPGFYLLFAVGIDRAGRKLADWIRLPERKRAYGGWGLLGLILAVHLVLFVPHGYVLPAKGVNYGDISRWLTENLEPGTPFVMESGYELRFVPGYFSTDSLVPACPYVHRAGKEEMQRLRQRQAAFMVRFPEAAFVESARHGADGKTDFSIWEWPHKYFRQRVEIRNDALRRLYDYGIWPQVSSEHAMRLQTLTPILYNTKEDIRKVMRDA
jgi:4-amino-4-deoxy-L-arabinose transferase-like glycosyltransferase